MQNGFRAAIPAYPVTVADTTAAGDAFNGAFAVALARGAQPLDAAQFAAAAAAISVTRRGALPSMPKLADVEEFIAERLRERQELAL
jgi:ribokinase